MENMWNAGMLLGGRHRRGDIQYKIQYILLKNIKKVFCSLNRCKNNKGTLHFVFAGLGIKSSMSVQCPPRVYAQGQTENGSAFLH